jgi:hypothetical protein
MRRLLFGVELRQRFPEYIFEGLVRGDVPSIIPDFLRKKVPVLALASR